MTAERTTGQALARRAREATGLGQAAFARLLGLHHTTVWSWEHAHRQPNPRMRSLLRLVEALPAQCLEILRDERGPDAVRERRRRGSQRQVLATLRRLAHGSNRSVPLDRVRAELSGVPRANLDQLLVTLETRHKVRLEPPLFLGCLGPAEREALLELPGREPLLFVSLPGDELPAWPSAP